MLSYEQVKALSDKEVPYRLEQLLLLNSLSTNKSTLIYGDRSIGKTYTLTKYLNHTKLKYLMIDCSIIVDVNLLLAKVYNLLSVETFKLKKVDRVRSFTNFQNFLSQLNQINLKKPIIIVLKNLENLNLSENLFKFFHEISSVQLKFWFLSSTITIPKKLLTISIPKIYFPNYSTEQIVVILLKKDLIQFPSAVCSGKVTTDDKIIFTSNFIKLIVDIYSPYSSNLNFFIDKIIENWIIFTKVIIENNYSIKTDFVKAYKEFSKSLSIDQSLKESIVSDTNIILKSDQQQLSILSKFLLIASYLASYNDIKNDFLIFSKLRSIRKRSIRRRQSSGALNSKMLSPKAFEFERMLAILNSIYQDSEYFDKKQANHGENDIILYHNGNTGLNTGMSTNNLLSNIDLYTEFSTLVSLRLIVKANSKASSGSSSNESLLNSRLKFKINCNWLLIKKFSRDLGFEIENYII
ncbi:hypothetical protein PACTADRAFT_47540, partial [Pachysolen tannophilus NRRL Y-2460]